MAALAASTVAAAVAAAASAAEARAIGVTNSASCTSPSPG